MLLQLELEIGLETRVEAESEYFVYCAEWESERKRRMRAVSWGTRRELIHAP